MNASAPVRGPIASTIARQAKTCAAMLMIAAMGVGASSCHNNSDVILRLGVPQGGVAPAKMEQREVDSLGLYYLHALEKTDPETETQFKVDRVVVDPKERITDLRTGKVGVTFGCVGELLDLLDAHKAQQLRELYRKEEKPDLAKWRDITHSTMMAALPAGVAASDPGIASICFDECLPQNIVALYDNEVLKRFDRRQLNNVAGGVSTEMLGRSEPALQATEPGNEEETASKAQENE
ncbi:hypothetical protein [Corynebacterium auriscanis]|uniref:hypothetical protein n=1 Tax=Corynebacterium auriscanis TaxID=99807 RepID=UPI003CF2154D